MELRHLRYFVAVAEEANVTRAAARLHVSQPGVSRQVRDLEAELGFTLLARDRRGVRLTEPGRVFLLEARAVLARAETAVATARSVAEGSRGQIHIGYAPSLTLQILPPALRALQSALPGTRVKLHDLTTEQMFAGLHNGKLDVALTVRPPRAAMRGLHFDALASSRLVVAVPPDHPLAGQRSVQLARLAKEPFVAYDHAAYPEYLDDVRRLFESAGLEPNLLEEHDRVSSLLTAIAAGRGVALVPETIISMTGGRIRLVPLQPPLPPITVGTVRRAGKVAAATAQFLAGLAGFSTIKTTRSASRPPQPAS